MKDLLSPGDIVHPEKLREIHEGGRSIQSRAQYMLQEKQIVLQGFQWWRVTFHVVSGDEEKLHDWGAIWRVGVEHHWKCIPGRGKITHKGELNIHEKLHPREIVSLGYRYYSRVLFGWVLETERNAGSTEFSIFALFEMKTFGYRG